MFTFSHEVQEPSRPVAVCSLEGLLNSMLAGSLEFKPAIWVSCLCQSRSRFGLQTVLKDWITGQARDDTVCSLVDLFRGLLSTFPPQKHLSTFKDPVIRVLSLFHHPTTTPRSPVCTPLSFAATSG